MTQIEQLQGAAVQSEVIRSGTPVQPFTASPGPSLKQEMIALGLLFLLALYLPKPWGTRFIALVLLGYAAYHYNTVNKAAAFIANTEGQAFK
jgi:hypothetical protein